MGYSTTGSTNEESSMSPDYFTPRINTASTIVAPLHHQQQSPLSSKRSANDTIIADIEAMDLDNLYFPELPETPPSAFDGLNIQPPRIRFRKHHPSSCILPDSCNYHRCEEEGDLSTTKSDRLRVQQQQDKLSKRYLPKLFEDPGVLNDGDDVGEISLQPKFLFSISRAMTKIPS